ncbi:OmpA family protein [Roseivivax sp. CAU 1753]
MTITILRRASLILCLWAGPLAAFEVPLPDGAEVTADIRQGGAVYALPTGPWTIETGIPVTSIEGDVTRRAWRIDGTQITPTQLLSPIRTALEQAGYTLQLDCAARRCGGFDFRFATDVIPAPDMYVDISNFRFLSAIGPQGDGVAVLTSRHLAAGYVQAITARPRGGDAVPALRQREPVGTVGTVGSGGAQVLPRVSADLSGIIADLESRGAVILQGVDFASGSAALDPGPVPELDALAAYLAATPDRRILLVGHTDAIGSLAGNRALSQRRAEAAAAYMRAANVALDQIAAEGAGYLAPIASNLTEAGRQANRRVEAVLLPRD